MKLYSILKINMNERKKIRKIEKGKSMNGKKKIRNIYVNIKN